MTLKHSRLSSDSLHMATIRYTMLFHNQFVGIVVDVKISFIHSDFITKNLGHFFKWDALRFWDEDPHTNGAKARENDED